MKSCNRILGLVVAGLFVLSSFVAGGQKSWVGTSATSPTWSQSTNWTPSGVPGSTDTVTIGDANFSGTNQPTINTSVTIAALTFANSKLSTLSLQNGGSGSLTVTGDLNDVPPNGGNDQTITVNDRTLTVQGNLNVGPSGGGGNPGTINVSTGTFQVNGTFTLNNKGRFLFSGAGTLVLQGNFSSAGTFTASTSTVNCNGSSAQTIAGVTYNTLKSNNPAGVTLSAAASLTTLTIGDVTSGSVFSDGGFVITTTGTLNLTSGTYRLGSATVGTAFPGYTTRNISAGTTVEYASGVAQAVATAPAYQNLTFSGAGAKTTAAGTLSIGGDWSISGGSATLSTNNSTISLTGNLTTTANILLGTSTSHTIGGNWTNNGGTITQGTGTVTFNNGSASQTINGTAASQPFNNLTVNKSGQILSVGGSTTALAINGNLSVANGTLDLGSATANRQLSGGTITVSNGATLKIGGTNTFPANYTTHTLGATSTVEYSGTSQAVSAENYGHLTLSGSGTKTLGGTTTVSGDLTNGSGVTFSAGSNTINLAGNWSNSGTFNAGTSTLNMNGSSGQTMSGSTFNNLTINNSNGVSILTDETVSGALTLTNGTVTTGLNRVIITSTGTVSRTAGYVAGFLQKNIPTGSNVASTFEIGGTTGYRPVDLNFASVTGTGDLIASVEQSAGDHPSLTGSGIDPTRSVNRYWTLTNSGIGFTTYDATFNFLPGDTDLGASTADFIVRKYSGSTWSGTTAGTRTSTSTQATGMTAFSDYAIGDACTFTLNETHANVTCNAGTDGSIDITPSGGTAPFAYSWNDGPTTEDRTGLSAGTYTVTATDANSCTGTATVSITQPTALSIGETHVNVSCFGGSNGSIDITVSGGTSPYTYGWSDGPTTEDRTGLAAGTYTVTVTDNHGCTDSKSVTITEPAAVSFSTAHTNVSCNGGSNGTITVTASGGTGTPEYSKDNGSTYQVSNVFSGLVAGTYDIVVRDANLCTAAAQPVTITEPTAVSFSTVHTDVSCNGGSNGTITVTASGGTGTLEYSKDNGSTYQVSNVFSGLTAGTYDIVVRDANLCTAAAQPVTITEPTALSIGETHVDVACFGGSNGSIDITVAGGTAPYTYSWSDGPTIEDRTGLVAGTYTVTVTDNHGCTDSKSVTITEPSALSIGETHGEVSCNGGTNGTIDITVSGGTTPYAYSWSDGPTTEDRTGLAAGTYTVTVTDNHGCTDSKSVTITEPAVLSAAEIHTDVSCFGGSNGSIDITVSGGTSPYTFSWNDGPVTEDRSGLAAGTYTVTVTDAHGCTASKGATITEPSAAVTFSTAHADVSCNGGTNGSITVTASGGTGTLEYSKDNGVTYQAPNVFSGLAAGTYDIVVRDANLCTAAAQPVTVSQPAALSIAETHTDVACNGGNTGSIDITVSGGTSPYTYSWNDGPTTEDRSGLAAGTYTVTVTDAHGCTDSKPVTIIETSPVSIGETHVDVSCFGGSNGSIDITPSGGTSPYTYSWNDGPTTEDRTGLTAGTYTVTVTDDHGCTAVKSVTITQPSAALSASETHTDLACFGASTGSIDITVSGGTSPYSYSWNDGPTTEDRTGLAAGTYTVTVTDAHGCTTSKSVDITQPASLFTVSVHNDTVCSGNSGTLTANGSGGVGPYTYLWSNSATTQSITVSLAGPYSVTATDANGCTATASGDLVVNPNPSISETHVNVSCHGGSNGSIDLTVSSGTAPYTFVWGDGPTTEDRSGLGAGTYSVTVTDAHGCTSATSIAITEPPALAAGETHVNVSCFGGSNGSIDITPSGGTSPYTFSWNDGPTTEDRSGLAAGTYTVTVTDDHGCTAVKSVTITQPAAALAAGETHVDVSCHGGSNGSIDITVSGGTSPYSYSWNDGPTTEDRTGLAAGTYTVTVTDANGCTTSKSATVGEPALSVSAAETHVDVTCHGGTNGSIDITASGGTGPYTFSWSDGPTTEDRAGLAAGTYTVTVTDNNGCTAVKSVTVTEPAAISATPSHTNVSCNGGADGSITVSASGGTGTLTYSNNGGSTFQSSNVFNGLAAAAYSIVVKDSSGCTTAPQSVTVTEPAAVTFTTSKTDAACNGSSTGSITVTASGGTGTLQYSKDGGTFYQPSNTFGSLGAATYSIVVKDANNCTSAPQSVTISEPAVLGFTTSKTDESCHGGTTGSITVTATGGTPAYSYSKDGGATYQSSNSFAGLAAATYSIVVKDANNCTTAPQSVTITEPAAISFSEVHANVNCNGGNDGSITVTSGGGTGTLSYSKDGGTTFQGSNLFANLSAGTYQIVVKDANGCVIPNQPVTITEPSATTISPASLPNGTVSVPYSQSISSSGGTGSHFLTTSGLPPGLSFPQGSTSPANLTGTPSAAGVYSITVNDTDSHLCGTSKVYSLTISKEPTTSTLSQSAGVSAEGEPVTFTDSVSGSIPDGGYAVLLDNGISTGDTVQLDPGGKAVFTVSSLALGTHSVSAYYSGTANFDSSTSNSLIHVITSGDTTRYRTAKFEEWALAHDQKGKLKSVKRKNDKVDFKLIMVAPRNAPGGFTLSLSMFSRGVVTRGKTKVDTLHPTAAWDSLKLVTYTTPVDSLDTLQIDGRGLKGKLITVKVTWKSLPKAVSVTYKTAAQFVYNQPRLPMPNLSNIGEELFPKGANQPSPVFQAGMLVGVPRGTKKANSVIHMKYADVLKSMIKRTKTGDIMQSAGAARCLDVFDLNGLPNPAKPITAQQKGLAPDKHKNKLFGEQIALKLNIAASQVNKFPNGFGELTYDDESDPSNPFNGQTVNMIAQKVDTLLACLPLATKLPSPSFGDAYALVRKINSSFTDGTIDTVTFGVKTVLTGVRRINGVAYLHKTNGIIPVSFEAPPVPWTGVPDNYALNQNYPNPFNPATTIQFELPVPSVVSLAIYNILGQEVATILNKEQMDEGEQEVTFDASNLSSGVYFYRIIAETVPNEDDGIAAQRFVETKRMLLLK